MFLLGWIIDAILTIMGTLVLYLFFGNSPITFIFFTMCHGLGPFVSVMSISWRDMNAEDVPVGEGR